MNKREFIVTIYSEHPYIPSQDEISELLSDGIPDLNSAYEDLDFSVAEVKLQNNPADDLYNEFIASLMEDVMEEDYEF